MNADIRACSITAVLEPVVHPDPKQARLEAVACAGEPIGPIRQVDIKILDPRRPGVVERDLHAGARGPAGMDPRFAHATELEVAAAEGKPERAVDEDVAEGIAEPAAHRPEPG